jgi:hypothetical protein
MGSDNSNIQDDLIAKLNNGESTVTANPIEVSALSVNPEDEKIAIEEAQVGKEFRAELVCKEDILKVVEMDKMSLEKYAHSRLGKKLDLSKRVKILRMEVVVLIKNKLSIPMDVDRSLVPKTHAPQGSEPEFIFNPVNRRVFEYTAILGKRSELIPCWLVDEEGKKL